LCKWIHFEAKATQLGWSSGDFIRHAVKPCDVFIFACHPVQADLPPIHPPWDFRKHLKDLHAALKEKIVFPENVDALLYDPIFTQDKAKLYEMLKDVMTPSLIIDRPADGVTFSEPVLRKIYDFSSKNYEFHEKVGLGKWHIKAGFSTASRGVARAQSIPDIPVTCRHVFDRLGLHSVPYIILQRTFSNSVVKSYL
jgi:hypothetical protein